MVVQKHLLHIFPTFAVGGAQIRFGQLARLHGQRYRHSVIALDDNCGMADRLTGFSVAIHRVRINKKNILKNWFVLQRALDSVKPDVLMTYNWGSIEWAFANRVGCSIPHVHIEDGFGPEEATAQLRRRVWARHFVLSGAGTQVILPSRTLERIAVGDWNLPRPQIHYVPNGIDCTRFQAQRRPRNSTDPEVVIGTVATLRREKNIARLIQAFGVVATSRRPGALRLVIVGDGPDRAALERLANTLPVSEHIHFVGASQEPAKWLQKMDVFAISSDTEQMPFSVLEAMASGLPVVSTQVGDIAQMVSPENAALIVSAGEEFNLALDRAAGDQKLRLEIGSANARRARELFEERLMAERYSQIIG